MKCSGEIIWELGAVLKSKGNLPIKSIHVCEYKTVFDARFGCDCQNDLGEFLGDLFSISLSKVIKGIHINSWVSGKHCCLTVWIADSEDGKTNIDSDVIEAFGKLKWREN